MRPKKIISLFSNNRTSLNDAKSYLNNFVECNTNWKNPDRVIMSADILKIESWLLPCCMITIDGRN